MKPYKKFLSFKHWLAVLRRQPKHMQHVYALVFSGAVTLLLGAFILYFDYGFWRDKYSAQDVVLVEKQQEKVVETVSPGQMMDGFLKEVGVRMQALKTTKDTLLEGKEMYTKDSQEASPQSVSDGESSQEIQQ
jgi:cell division protein FtsB